MKIKVADPKKVIVRDVQSSGPAFAASLEKAAEAGQFTLRIKPARLTPGTRAAIRIDVTVVGRMQPFIVYAAVK